MRFFNQCDGIHSSVNPNFLGGKEMENFDICDKDQFCEVCLFKSLWVIIDFLSLNCCRNNWTLLTCVVKVIKDK